MSLNDDFLVSSTKSTQESDKMSNRMSIMRISTAPRDDATLRPANESIETRNKRILDRRVVFRWLPIATQNDLVCGAWWFVWGSVLTILIPVFPLISLFEDFWEQNISMPLPDHVAAYVMLIFAGISYTIGSWIFTRTFKEPIPPPLVQFWYFSNDELLATWMFVIGTLPSVPIMIIYCYYFPEEKEYQLALALCIFFSAAFLAYIVAVSPLTKEKYEEKKKLHHMGVHTSMNYISPILHTCCCSVSGCYCPKEWIRHVANDWLIVCWLSAIGCFLAVLLSIALLVSSIQAHDKRGIFDWATGLADMIMFLIGSMYLVAGSYPVSESLLTGSKNNPLREALDQSNATNA